MNLVVLVIIQKTEIVEKMVHYECTEKRMMLGKYLKCLTTIEKLCNIYVLVVVKWKI